MAQTFDGAQYPDIQRFTLSATPDNATEVVIVAPASKATVRFESNAGKLAFDGTDGAAVNANHIVVTADATHQFSLTDGIAVSKGVGSFFVASATASTVVSVMLEG
jgi:hypothetical protein